LLVVLSDFSKYFKGKVNSERNGQLYDGEFIGKKVRVRNRIIPFSNEGRIEFEGTDWKAVSDCEIEEGQMVEIVSKDNITFRVKPVIVNNGK
jgi:membrane protein implicated in regulation of membrane protease activity